MKRVGMKNNKDNNKVVELNDLVKKNKVGRPKSFIDWHLVSEFFEAHATTQEIAAYFGIDDDTLNDRCRKENHTSITTFSARCKRKGKLKLRMAQYEQAKQGHFGSLIWLGKNWLDQKDNPVGTLEPDGKLVYMVNLMKAYVRVRHNKTADVVLDGDVLKEDADMIE